MSGWIIAVHSSRWREKIVDRDLGNAKQEAQFCFGRRNRYEVKPGSFPDKDEVKGSGDKLARRRGTLGQ